MARPLAEREFSAMCGRLNIWCHKWQHVRRCPHCYQMIFTSKQSSDQDKANTETIVDYLIFIGSDPWWIECKGTNKETRINIRDEPSPKQRGFLDSWEDRSVGGGLFLTLGNGPAPKKRKAWLIPWDWWQEEVYDLIEDGMISLPWIKTNRKNDRGLSIDSMFYNCELEWTKGVGWTFPEVIERTLPNGEDTMMSGFWTGYYHNLLSLPPLYE